MLDEISKQCLELQPHITDLPSGVFIDLVWRKARHAHGRFMEADGVVRMAHSKNSYPQIEIAIHQSAAAALLIGKLSEMFINASLHQAGITVVENEPDTLNTAVEWQDPE